MKIYLKWTGVQLTGNSKFSLFDLEIYQEENSFPKARLVIDALISLPPTGTEGIICLENDEILFKGLLVGSLIKIEGAFGEIELVGKPLDFLNKISALQKESRVHPYWDGLWVSPAKRSYFHEIQDIRAASLFCDPRTGQLSLSDWFEGRKTIPLYKKFFPQSLQIKLVTQPLQSCTVNVHAHWIQWTRGVSNLGPQIGKAFSQHKVNTYTEKALVEKWPEAGKRLGRSGLQVLKSELKPMVPVSPLYPNYSPPLSLGEEKGERKTYRVKRYWFKPILWVRWQIRQKRKETLSLTLSHDFQVLFPAEGRHKTIDYTLQNINPDPDVYAWQPEYFYRAGAKVSFQNSIYKCKTKHTSHLSFQEDQALWILKKVFHTPLGDPARASFFLTDRGYQAAEHAMERAKVKLAKSARCLQVWFEGSWDELKEATTDTSIILSDPRLPGGEVKGKVVKHVLIAKGETGERVAQITLLCAAGTGKELQGDFPPTPLYSLADYGDETYQVHENQVCKTPTGLSYFRYDQQGQPEDTKRGALLRGIQLTNGPQEQETELRQRAYTSPTALKKALSQKQTGLRLFFKDLRTKGRLDHVIQVKMAAPWSAPRQFVVG